MKELPKELTSELLGLVLGRNAHILAIENNELVLVHTVINLDTLTRLMKEWCLEIVDSQFNDVNSGKSEYKVKRFNRLTEREESNHKYYCELVVDNNGATIFKTAHSELEAIIKATHYIATQKGLLCT